MAESFRLRVPLALADAIAGFHPELKRKVRAATDAIREDRVTRPVIEIVAVGERATIYQETLRLVRRERGATP